MIVCTGGCEQGFPRLTANRCNKCIAWKPGLGPPELEHLNSRPQCAGCGLMSNNLSGLCKGCIAFYRTADVIPREFLGNSTILEVLSTSDNINSGILDFEVDSLSSTANSILATAVTHQENTSESRIGVQVHKGSTKSKPAGLQRFKTISKQGGIAGGIIAERKAKKADWVQQHSMTGPKFSIALWKSRGIEDKPKLVNQIQFSRVYEASTPTKRVLEDLLECLNANFKSLFHVNYDILWSQITMFAHESATVAASIEYLRSPEAIDSGTAGSWLMEFRTQRLCSKASLEAGILNIRFLVDNAIIPDIEPRDEDSYLMSRQLGSFAKPTTSLSSKRKRANSTLVASTPKRPNAQASARARNILQEAGDVFLQPDLPASVTRPAAGGSTHLTSTHLSSARQSGARILKSAFRPPTPIRQWSRDVQLVDYQFTRSTAQYQANGDVEVTRVSESLEVIAIADDWLKGEELSKRKEHYNTGFIGCGFTKRGIYARYDNKEYVITQPRDERLSFSEVRAILNAELKLLAQCDGIKEKFDEFVEEDDIKGIPAFYFNFKGAFYGEIEPLSASQHRSIPHIGFLATPLLPCGRFDDPVTKFSGSDDLGPADDILTEAVHAFVHFAWMYSREQVLFCDMQGTRDRYGIMCLIDPQAHTTEPRTENTIYWDGGRKKIIAWKQQHLPDSTSEATPSSAGRSSLCQNNRICNALQLRTLEMEELGDQQPSPSKPTSKKPNVEFLVHQKDVAPRS